MPVLVNYRILHWKMYQRLFLEFGNTGQSIMEVSHRSADFQAVYDEAVALFKEVLNIPEGYSVLFLGGGASMQFCMIPVQLFETRKLPT